MKEEIITPIKTCSFLHAQPATIPLIRSRTVSILLLHFYWQVKELAPNLTNPLHQFVAHTMVHYLKEAPFTTGSVDTTEGLFAEALVVRENVLEINNRNVDLLR
jgi:hypothetical protein